MTARTPMVLSFEDHVLLMAAVEDMAHVYRDTHLLKEGLSHKCVDTLCRIEGLYELIANAQTITIHHYTSHTLDKETL